MISCNSPYRLRYWNWLQRSNKKMFSLLALQQSLPFTVLKPCCHINTSESQAFIEGCNSPYRLRYWNYCFLRMLWIPFNISLQQSLPFTVLKQATDRNHLQLINSRCNSPYRLRYWNKRLPWRNALADNELQQSLPFTVLKLWLASMRKSNAFRCCNSTYRLRYWNALSFLYSLPGTSTKLQQHLPFTVLKLRKNAFCFLICIAAPTVYGIETVLHKYCYC